ncbi:MAG TPA: 3-phosphoshikimate 1-carboxyvinyltransferase [Acidobacteriota bacterium]
MTKSIELPGDKSISHRIAMLAVLADNACSFTNFNTGADCYSTLECLRTLGANSSPTGVTRPNHLHASQKPLDCGNSGSAMRMLTGLLAGQQIPATLIGDSSLMKRPMKRIADPLRQMGAVVELRNDEYAPIELKEGTTHGIEYTSPVSSAQIKTAVMFAGLKFANTRVIEPFPSRDHTERLFEHLQIEPGPAVNIPAFSYMVPGDPSSAAFLIVAALLNKEEVLFRNILLNQHRIAFLRVLERAGASVKIVEEWIQQNEMVGDIQVHTDGIKEAIVIQPEEVSGLIDEIPALTMAGMTHGIEVHGARELRYKESDRIQAMTSNLRLLGLEVDEWEDGYRIHPGKPRSTSVPTYGDHRIAMAFSAAGFAVDDPECATISFPEFYDLLNTIL